MKKHIRIFAFVLVIVMIASCMFACSDSNEKQIVGKVNGVAIPDSVFINYFFYEMDEETGSESWPEEYKELYGKELYDALSKKQSDGSSYLEKIIANAMQESRLFMIEYLVFSEKDTWPGETAKQELKDNAESYVEQMFSYYGSSFGAESVEDFVEATYSMKYDDLIEYFVMSGCLESYKDSFAANVTVTDEEISAFYEANKKDYHTVEVRHSLLQFEEDARESDKKELFKEAQELVEKYNAGEITFDDIMEKTGDVDSEGKPNNNGYYTVFEGAGFVAAFEEWGLKQEEASDKIEIVETEYGYHIMMCTKILDIADSSVKERVTNGCKTEVINKTLEAEIKPYKEDSKYNISEYNDEYAKVLAKRAITGSNEEDSADSTESSASATAGADATAAPTSTDAEADKTLIAKYNGKDVYKSYYSQFFSQAVNKSLEDYDFSEISDIEEKSEYYAALRNLLNSEYKDGKTYIEYAKEEGLNLMLKFLATKDMAIADEKNFTDKEIEEMLKELDEEIDSMLTYYGEAYGAKTRDDLMKQLMGMNVNDYKNIYIDQMLVSEYSASVIEDMKVEEDVLKAHYEKEPNSYRVVTIRTISKALVDDENKALSEDKQKEAEQIINAVKAKYENGDSAEALAVGYSDSLNSYNGLIDLVKASSSIAKEVHEWAFNQTEIGAYTIIKTEHSYEFVIIEGMTYYEKQVGITAYDDVTTDTVKEEVKSQYKDEAYDAQVGKYVKDNNLSLESINDSAIKEVVDNYMEQLEPKEETEKK